MLLWVCSDVTFLLCSDPSPGPYKSSVRCPNSWTAEHRNLINYWLCPQVLTHGSRLLKKNSHWSSCKPSKHPFKDIKLYLPTYYMNVLKLNITIQSQPNIIFYYVYFYTVLYFILTGLKNTINKLNHNLKQKEMWLFKDRLVKACRDS